MSNLEFSTNLLLEKDVSFESKSEGLQLIVKGQGKIVDFYPTTGLFIVRGGKRGRGVKQLLKLVTCNKVINKKDKEIK